MHPQEQRIEVMVVARQTRALLRELDAELARLIAENKAANLSESENKRAA